MKEPQGDMGIMTPQGAVTSPEAVAVPPEGVETPVDASNQGAQIEEMLEQRMSELPDQQKAFIAKYLTPELSLILGIILGQESADYFANLADPSKMLTVVPRPPQGATAEQQGAAAGSTPQGAMTSVAAPPAPAMGQ